MAPKTRKVAAKSKRKNEKSDKKLTVSMWKLKLQRQLQADGEIIPENKPPCSSNISDATCRTEDLAAKIRDSFSCLSNPRRFAERIKEKFYVLSSRSLNRPHAPEEVRWQSCANDQDLSTSVSSTSNSKKKKLLNVNSPMRLIMGMQQAEKEYMLRTLWETHPKMDFLVLQNILAACQWDLKKAQQVLDAKLNVSAPTAGDCAKTARRKRKRDNPVKKVSTIPNASDKVVDVQNLQSQIKPEVLKMQLRRALQQSAAKEGDSDCEIVEVVDKRRTPKKTRRREERVLRKSPLKSPSGSILRKKLLEEDA